MFNIVPRKTIEISSPLSKEEAFDAITQRIHKVKRFGFSTNSRDSFFNYEGYIEGDKIIFRGILKQNRNSFIPRGSAIITKDRNHTIVKLNANAEKFTAVFSIFFFMFTLLMFVIGTYQTIVTKNANYIIVMPIASLFLMILSRLIIYVFFTSGVYHMEKDMREMVKNAEPPSGNIVLNKLFEKLFFFNT